MVQATLITVNDQVIIVERMQSFTFYQEPETAQSTASSAVMPFYDATDPTNCEAFAAARRKLRLVLANVDMECTPRTLRLTRRTGGFDGTIPKAINALSGRNSNTLGAGQSLSHVVSATGSLGGGSAVEMAERQGQDEPGHMTLLSLLRTLLADAQLNDQQSIVANVRECIRIVSFFDSRG